MQYRDFGKTGLKVSALGFGTMRLPLYPNTDIIDEEKAINLIHTGIDKGINYIDTAYTYQNGMSEVVVGKALAVNGYRDKAYIATKAPVWEYNCGSDFDRYLNEQLQKLQTDHIDFYLLHSLDANLWDNKVIKYNVLEHLLNAKRDGRVKYIGFSFNDDINMFKWICDYWEEWDFCQIHLNYIDEEYQAGLKGLKHAVKRGMAVNIMEPLKGGYLANVPAQTQKVFDEICAGPVEIAMQYLWDKEGVGCVLSDMGSFNHLEENLGYAEISGIGMLSGKRVVAIKKAQLTVQQKKIVPCDGCNICGRCPHHVKIFRNFEAINKLYIHDNLELAQDYYKGSVALVGGEATACVGCRWCESVCPKHIEISHWMKKVHEILKV